MSRNCEPQRLSQIGSESFNFAQGEPPRVSPCMFPVIGAFLGLVLDHTALLKLRGTLWALLHCPHLPSTKRVKDGSRECWFKNPKTQLQSFASLSLSRGLGTRLNSAGCKLSKFRSSEVGQTADRPALEAMAQQTLERPPPANSKARKPCKPALAERPPPSLAALAAL